MTHVPEAHDIETYTGRYVNTLDPESSTICVEDIAHHLSLTCRYGGACSRFYSVAEHAVLVSERLETLGRPVYQVLAGLHHDDAESYLGDIPRPMKGLLGDAYAELSRRMDEAIVAALPWPSPLFTAYEFHTQPVKDADNWALFLEARHFLPSRGVNWAGSGLEDLTLHPDQRPDDEDPPYWYGGLEPTAAETLFLDRHYELIRR